MKKKHPEENTSLSEPWDNALWLDPVVNSLEEAVLLLTPDRHLVNVNDAAEKMFGYSRKELFSLSSDILHVDQGHFDTFNRKITQALEKEKCARFKFKAKRKNGEVFPTEHTVSLIQDTKGQPLGMVNVVRSIKARKNRTRDLAVTHRNLKGRVDQRAIELENTNVQLEKEIEKRKLYEKALWKEKERIQQYLDIAGVIIVVIDADQRVALLNKEGSRILGYEKSEIIGRNWFDHCVPNQDREFAQMTFDQLMAGDLKTASDIENRVETKTGETRLIAWRNQILKDDTGQITATLSSGLDITQRKILEEQLRQGHKMEAIGTLAGGIAHEFNNALGIIIGNVELSMDDIAPEPTVLEYLEDAKSAALRAKDVVRQLMVYSRKTLTMKNNIDVAPVVEGAHKMLLATMPSNIELQLTMRENLHSIVADPNQIHQVLINLATNSAHAIGDKPGILKIDLKNADIDTQQAGRYDNLTPGAHLCLRITDSGHGIPADIQDKIFDPYFTTRAVGQGSGMGLAVVHGIMADLHGAITVQSKAGRGTTFTLLFPKSLKKARQTDTSADASDFGSEQILVVDDEPAMVKIARQVLTRLGYKVRGETDPLKALALFKTNPDAYDLVITDMTMPQMNGNKLSEAILNIRAQTPILLCTGYSEHIDEERSKALGIRHYVEKPLTKNKIARLVRKILDGDQGQKGLYPPTKMAVYLPQTPPEDT